MKDLLAAHSHSRDSDLHNHNPLLAGLHCSGFVLPTHDGARTGCDMTPFQRSGRHIGDCVWKIRSRGQARAVTIAAPRPKREV
jgi:hypothetical protein